MPAIKLLHDAGNDGGTICVQVVPPESADTSPTASAFLFVIDVSGSMDDAATVKNEDGGEMNLGFSLLDIAKHATSTFVDTLSSHDMVAIVSFSCSATKVLPWTRCDQAGKKRALEAIGALHTIGSTNLAAGVTAAFELFGAGFRSDWLSSGCDFVGQLPVGQHHELDFVGFHSIVLTDGRPSCHPEGGARQARLSPDGGARPRARRGVPRDDDRDRTRQQHRLRDAVGDVDRRLPPHA